jgi:ABC-type Fe3+ transport system substrate-binding protein
MKKTCTVLLLVFLTVAFPFLMKKEGTKTFGRTDDVVIVITPHNESIRYEIESHFKPWYLAKTGRSVAIDWRTPGSGGEILKYVDSVFTNAFRLYWERVLHRTWSQEAQSGFRDYSLNLSEQKMAEDTLAVSARRAFLDSNVGCGVDVLFGGGVIEHKKEADYGQLVDCGLLKTHPEWFCDDVIPERNAGERLWDAEGRWIGSSLSGFGIVYNADRVGELGFEGLPRTWQDLTSPLFFKQVAMVDPVQSSVVVKCFEIIFQQQMQMKLEALKSKEGVVGDDDEREAIREGWMEGLKLIQKMMANARYFTDNSVKTISDISSGNCATGIVVDFYGRYQREVVRERSGSSRVGFVAPKGGSIASPDPIAMFRGAPNAAVAAVFIEYVMSYEGQALIGLKLGVPDGPNQYVLCRTPMRKDFYRDENKPFMIDPKLNPFVSEDLLYYREDLAAKVFHAIRFLTKAIFMDAYNELSAAWGTIVKAQRLGYHEKAREALEILEDLSSLHYDYVVGELSSILKQKRPLTIIQLSARLSRHFRQQYRRARYRANI